MKGRFAAFFLGACRSAKLGLCQRQLVLWKDLRMEPTAIAGTVHLTPAAFERFKRDHGAALISDVHVILANHALQGDANAQPVVGPDGVRARRRQSPGA